MKSVPRKLDFNRCQVSLLCRNSLLVRLQTFQLTRAQISLFDLFITRCTKKKIQCINLFLCSHSMMGQRPNARQAPLSWEASKINTVAILVLKQNAKCRQRITIKNTMPISTSNSEESQNKRFMADR